MGKKKDHEEFREEVIYLFIAYGIIDGDNIIWRIKSSYRRDGNGQRMAAYDESGGCMTCVCHYQRQTRTYAGGA